MHRSLRSRALVLATLLVIGSFLSTGVAKDNWVTAKPKPFWIWARGQISENQQILAYLSPQS